MSSSLTEGDCRRLGLLEWLWEVGQSADIEGYYRHVGVSKDVIWDDHVALQGAGLIVSYREGGGKIEARLTADGRDRVLDVRRMREQGAERRWACRSAMLQWLDSQGAHGDLARGVTWDGFRRNPRSNFYGESFAEGEVDSAAAWLKRQALIDGLEVDEREGPIRSFLTDLGLECAESGGDVRAWDTQRNASGASGPSYSFGNLQGNVQVAIGSEPTQTMNIGLSSDELASVLKGLLEVFHEAFEDLEIRNLEDRAFAGLEAGDPEPTRSLLQRVAAVAKSQTAKSGSLALASFVTWGAQLLEQLLVHARK